MYVQGDVIQLSDGLYDRYTEVRLDITRYNYDGLDTFFNSNKKNRERDKAASQVINLGNTGESTWDSSITQIANLTN